MAEQPEEVAEGLHLLDLQRLELGELRGVLAVVREVVMAEADARDRRHAAGPQQHDRDEPRRIGLDGQVGEVEQQPGPAEQVGPLFLRPLQPPEQAPDGLHRLDLHHLQLRQFTWVLAVV